VQRKGERRQYCSKLRWGWEVVILGMGVISIPVDLRKETRRKVEIENIRKRSN
jgi:hypothetical protein